MKSGEARENNQRQNCGISSEFEIRFILANFAGMSMDEPDAVRPVRWRGENRLGRIMEEVREKLIKMPQYAKVR